MQRRALLHSALNWSNGARSRAITCLASSLRPHWSDRATPLNLASLRTRSTCALLYFELICSNHARTSCRAIPRTQSEWPCTTSCHATSFLVYFEFIQLYALLYFEIMRNTIFNQAFTWNLFGSSERTTTCHSTSSCASTKIRIIARCGLIRNREEIANDGIARTIEPQNCLLVILWWRMKHLIILKTTYIFFLQRSI